MLLILLAGGGTACSTLRKSSSTYSRFWRGFQRADLKQAEFESRINREFFALYPDSVPYGLLSYLPVLPIRARTGGPDEWALVTYRSEAEYQRFKASEPGKIAADAHWKVFARDVSYSTVVEPFNGRAEAQHAYVTDPGFRRFTSDRVVFALYSLRQPESHTLPEIVANISRNHGAPERDLRNIVFLVTPDHVAEYLFLRPDADVAALLPSLGADQVIQLREGLPGSDEIREGQGLKSRL